MNWKLAQGSKTSCYDSFSTSSSFKKTREDKHRSNEYGPYKTLSYSSTLPFIKPLVVDGNFVSLNANTISTTIIWFYDNLMHIQLYYYHLYVKMKKLKELKKTHYDYRIIILTVKLCPPQLPRAIACDVSDNNW